MKITVRLVRDTSEYKCWFEEKLPNGQWVEIPETKMSCEGNSRHRLEKELERRRQNRLMIHRSYDREEELEY